MNKNGKTSDTDENHSESEGMSQPTGLISMDMSLGGSHATRMLRSPGGGTCGSGRPQGLFPTKQGIRQNRHKWIRHNRIRLDID